MCGTNQRLLQLCFSFSSSLERELAPVEERLSRLNVMVRKEVAANPKETRQVQAKKAEITALLDKLKVHVSRVPRGSNSNA